MIEGIHHVGISVSDLNSSITFYRDILGMQLVAQLDFAGERIERIVGLKCARGRAVLMRLKTLQLELFEFASPTPQPGDRDRPVCDHGITHFCLLVTDIQAEFERLVTAGVRFHCPPQRGENTSATYARDPDGNVFELLELRAGADDL